MSREKIQSELFPIVFVGSIGPQCVPFLARCGVGLLAEDTTWRSFFVL